MCKTGAVITDPISIDLNDLISYVENDGLHLRMQM